MQYEVKILPKYFERILRGEKKFELRKNDRDFQVGDVVILNEFDNVNNKYTGRILNVEITYILKDCSEYGLMDGYCIFGFVIIDKERGLPYKAGDLLDLINKEDSYDKEKLIIVEIGGIRTVLKHAYVITQDLINEGAYSPHHLGSLVLDLDV